MSLIPRPIVMIQHFPATGDYIVYREGETAQSYKSGPLTQVEDFQRYIKECTVSGCFRETTFGAAMGLTSGFRTVNCKQVIYCKAFGMTSAVPQQPRQVSVEGADETVQQSLFSWVKWNPFTYELTVCSNRIPIPKTNRMRSLSEAPLNVKEFILSCFNEGKVALKRSYNRPLAHGGATRLTWVTEYYFAGSKVHKDFQAGDTVGITQEEFDDLGLNL